MTVACAQFAPEHRNMASNRESIRALVERADADLIIFPELCTTGYFFTERTELRDLAEPVDGRSSAYFSELAAKHNVAIIAGILEQDGGRYYNSSLAFGSDGKLCGHYRKTHLFYYETKVFDVGNLGFPVFELITRSGPVRAGMLVCYDWRFPEAARSIALQGAEIIAMPSNIVTTTGMLHTTLQTRAFENKVAVAFADRIGTETNANETLQFRGESAIISYNGEVLAKASASGEEIIRATLDLEKTREKRINQFNDIFTDRLKSGYNL